MLSAALLLAFASPADMPLTTAERTDYRQTSTHADVIAFLRDLQATGAPVAVRMIGKSHEGREIPMAIAARPPVAGPADARRSGKPIVYVQANIHGGEVEGKEASLMLLRDLCREEEGLLDDVILLVVPIYNVDGNERFGDVARNRPSQDGPEQVGQRANGQGFDLNRDCMKAESPEMRAVLKEIYNTWDPDVIMDLHTTNGTRHGYQLTYSPPLCPTTEPGILDFSRKLVADVRAKMRNDGFDLQDYGNVSGSGAGRAWRTFGWEPRYVTNYAGIRNRIGVLSEAASFQPFRIRVLATYEFVKSVLRVVSESDVPALTRAADANVVRWGLNPSEAPELGVRFEMASRGEEEVLLEKPGSGVARNRAPNDFEMVRMPIYDRFAATRKAQVPAAYLVPPSEREAVELLQLHGVVTERLLAPWTGAATAFVMNEVVVAPNPFQGRRLTRLEGDFSDFVAEAGEGWYVIRTAQPLGILVFNMLEPESLDGVAGWGFLSEVREGARYPILKVMRPLVAVTERM